VDDILVLGRTLQEHVDNIRSVLQKCKENQAKLKLEKCIFARKEVVYLGYKITGEHIEPVGERVDKIASCVAPTSRDELRKVISKLNFYSRFIENYTEKLEPLRQLFAKSADLHWTISHQNALNMLIGDTKHFRPQLLAPRECHKTITIHVACESFEVALMNDENQLISRSGKLLSSTESNYTRVEKHLLALIHALERFKVLIDPTNHSVLTR